MHFWWISFPEREKINRTCLRELKLSVNSTWCVRGCTRKPKAAQPYSLKDKPRLTRRFIQERMKVLESLDIVGVAPYSLRRVYQLGSVYPTQRVLVIYTDHSHFLYSTKADQRDLILPILVMHFLPGTINIRGELQSLTYIVLLCLGMLIGHLVHKVTRLCTIPS
jgi:hypothetical protein